MLIKKRVLVSLFFLAISVVVATDEAVLEKLWRRLPQPTPPSFFEDNVYEFYPDSKPNPNYANLNNPWLCLKAFQFGYEEVGTVMYDSDLNDWCIDVNETRLYWASGRLLQIEELQNYEEYNPLIQYYYNKELFDPKNLTLDDIERLKLDSIIATHKNSKKQNHTFYEIIYGKFEKEAMHEKLTGVNFFGSIAYMHERVAPATKRAIAEMRKSKNTPEMRAFLSNYRESYGFNWRVIADSGAPSNHAWGIAIDLMAKDYKKQKVYWFWEASTKEYWMMFTPEERWKPADAIIEAFENEGFIWGGYWDIWDTMHFEYKPELIYITHFFSSPDPHEFREEINEAPELNQDDDTEDTQNDNQHEEHFLIGPFITKTARSN